MAPAVLQAQLPGLARSWLQHLGQELDKGTVTVWNEELEGNLRLAEVVDQIPEQMWVLAERVEVTLLDTPVVYVDLKEGLQQIA